MRLPKPIGFALIVVAAACEPTVNGFGVITTIGGVQIGTAIATGKRWFVISLAMRPLFIVRIAGGALVAAGLFLFVGNLLRTSASGADAPVEEPLSLEPAAVGAGA